MRHRTRTPFALLAITLLLSLLAGCGKSVLPSCPGEDGSTRGDGVLPTFQTHTVSDPTAHGALRGRPTGLTGRDRPKKMILLLDYSGSMYAGYGKARVVGCDLCSADRVGGRSTRTSDGRTQPYYVASKPFQDFLAAWLDAATPAESDLGLEVLLFNGKIFRLGERGSEPFVPGTELRFERRVSKASLAEIAEWLKRIEDNPYKVDPTAPGTTDSFAALRTALTAIGDDEAILWLITDNIVDTDGGALDDSEARLTTSFYDELKAEPRVQMIDAYPIFQRTSCSWMCGTSLFAYGMYVSHFERPESTEFHRLGGTNAADGGPTAEGFLWNSDLQKLAAQYSGWAAEVRQSNLAGVPLRLKPIDTEALAIRFGRPALRCDHTQIGQPLRCQAWIEVRNTLRHQTVDRAELKLSNEILRPHKEGSSRRLSWASAVCARQVETFAWRVGNGPLVHEDSIKIGRLAPLQKVVVDVRFKLPAVAVDTAGRSTLFDVALTNRILLDGLLHAEIRDFHTSLAINEESFASVYGSVQLPAIFRKGYVGSASATYRIETSLYNNGQTLALLALLGIGSIGALCALVALRFKRKQFTVWIDGIEGARLSLPRFSRREIAIGGTVRAFLCRAWGADYRLAPRPGVKIRRDGSSFLLRIGKDLDTEHRIEIRRGWSPARPKSPFGSHLDPR